MSTMICGPTQTAKAVSLVAKMKTGRAGLDVAWGPGHVDVDKVLAKLDGDNVPTFDMTKLRDSITRGPVPRKEFDTFKLRDSINRDGYRGWYSNVHRAPRVRLPYPKRDDPDDPVVGSDYFDDSD